MKSSIPLQQFRKCVILFMVGAVCSALAYALYAINPLKVIIEYNLQFAKNSFTYTLWQKPPIDVYIKVYVFNITNPEAFSRGEEKLKLQEIGPYVYQEILENTNVTFNDNGTVSYSPKRLVISLPEKSVNDPRKEYFNGPNVPFLGIFSSLSDQGFLINYPLSHLANVMNSQSILNITVHDYLWGYEDPLIRLAGNMLPNFINFEQFGLLDRLYDEGNIVLNINLNSTNDKLNEIGRYLSINELNGNKGLPQWGYRAEKGNETYPENTVCNRVQGASDGILLPYNIDRRMNFRIFRKAFCRAIPIEYESDVVTSDGYSGYKYKPMDNFLDTPDQNPDNKCYCRYLKKCYRKGVSDISPCYYNVPMAMSLPHFLNADPSLLDEVDGLRPNETLHSSSLSIIPSFGIPIQLDVKLQINLVMNDVRYNSKIAPFNNIVLPLIWIQMEVDSVDSSLTFLLKLGLEIMPIVQTGVICLLSVIGVAIIILSVVATLRVLNQKKQESGRRDSADLRVPLGYGQYTAIRILPAIKKITSKTDLFS